MHIEIFRRSRINYSNSIGVWTVFLVGTLYSITTIVVGHLRRIPLSFLEREGILEVFKRDGVGIIRKICRRAGKSRRVVGSESLQPRNPGLQGALRVRCLLTHDQDGQCPVSGGDVHGRGEGTGSHPCIQEGLVPVTSNKVPSNDGIAVNVRACPDRGRQHRPDNAKRGSSTPVGTYPRVIFHSERIKLPELDLSLPSATHRLRARVRPHVAAHDDGGLLRRPAGRCWVWD